MTKQECVAVGLPHADHTQAEQWAASVAHETIPSICTSIGLISGGRDSNDKRAVHTLARCLSQKLIDRSRLRSLLLVIFDVYRSRDVSRAVDQPPGPPRASRSPLGKWHEVEIPMPVGRTPSWSLQQLPGWLASWKREHSVILLDMGPMDLLPSRAIGSLCDDCYLLLGPSACGSPEWIQQHLAWHDRCGSRITGTLVTTLSKAA